MKFFAFRQPAMRAGTPGPWNDFWYTRDGFVLGGQSLSPERALTCSPFWKATRFVSENIASCSAKVYERLDRGHAPCPRHPMTWTIGNSPSPWFTAFNHWETTVVHLIHCGNAYALKRRVLRGRKVFVELDIVHPDRVTVERLPNREPYYTVRDANGANPHGYGRDQIMHIMGMSGDGLTGISMVKCATDSIDGALSAENYAHRFFKQGAMAGLAAIPETNIGPEGSVNLAKSVRSYLTGLDNAHSVFVPPDKITLQTIGYDAEKAQILLTRQFTTEQVAHWFNLPPGMLGDSKTPTFASSKQFRQDLVDLCFRPWIERIEDQIDIDLLQFEDEDPLRYFAKFEMDALLRGNATERAAIHESAIRSGYKTRNEARLDEDMRPLPKLDEPIAALNMGNQGQSRSGGSDSPNARIAERTAELLVRKEIGAATKAAIRFAGDASGWQGWLREFYAVHAKEVAERLRLPVPVAQEYASRQGLRLAERGVQVLEDWQSSVVGELTELALSDRLEAAAVAIEEAA